MTEAPDSSECAELGMNSAAACALKIVKNAFSSFFFSFVHRCCSCSESFKGINTGGWSQTRFNCHESGPVLNLEGLECTAAGVVPN